MFGFNKPAKYLKSFKDDKSGVTAIEYAIIGVAISAIVLIVFTGDNGLQEALTDAMATITGNINSANVQS